MIKQTSTYEIKKGLTGQKIHYTCANERCRADLCSPLQDAGTRDDCPDCGATFTVPGLDKVREMRANAERKRKQAEDIKQRKAQARKLAQVQKLHEQAVEQRERERRQAINDATHVRFDIDGAIVFVLAIVALVLCVSVGVRIAWTPFVIAICAGLIMSKLASIQKTIAAGNRLKLIMDQDKSGKES